MTQQIKYLAARACILCLSITLLQACSNGHQAEGRRFSVYSVGDFEYNFVISGNKYLMGYGVEQNNPTYYADKYGKIINKSNTPGEHCVNFGNDFSVGTGRSSTQFCNGWRIEKHRSENGISLYFGFCPPKSSGCPDGYDKKPMIEYGLGKESNLLFFKFDPMARDSKPYTLKMGSPLSLSE